MPESADLLGRWQVAPLLLLALLVSLGATEWTTLRCAFVQEKRLAILPEPLLLHGVVEASRPLGALRWEFSGRSWLLLRDGRVRRFNAIGREEGSDDPALLPLAAQMRGILRGDLAPLEELFALTRSAEDTVLTPRDPALARYVERLVFTGRPGAALPERLVLHAAAGDQVEYRFAAPDIDPVLPPERFAPP